MIGSDNNVGFVIDYEQPEKFKLEARFCHVQAFWKKVALKRQIDGRKRFTYQAIALKKYPALKLFNDGL